MSEADDHFFMSTALQLAQQAAEQGEVPVGAVVVSDGQIIGRGWNQPITCHDPTAHAEVMAIRDAAQQSKNYRLPDATLYVTIEPCTMCAGAMIHARIARLVYGAKEPKAGVAESNGKLFSESYYNHVVEVTGGVMSDQCASLISDFFAKRRQLKKANKLAN